MMHNERSHLATINPLRNRVPYQITTVISFLGTNVNLNITCFCPFTQWISWLYFLEIEQKEYFEFYAKSVKHSVLHIYKICFSFNRKKLKSTSKYIYQTLFLNGENSDIKICALGEEWNLHKIYLCQVSILFFCLSKQGSYLKIAQTLSSHVLSNCISQQSLCTDSSCLSPVI